MRPDNIRWLDLCMRGRSSSCAPFSRRNRSTSAVGAWLPVPTLPELSPTLHPSPGQIQYMSNVTALKRQSRRKFKSKLPFVAPRGIGPSSSPLNMQANHPELFALLTTQPEADEDERRCDVAGCATEPPVSRRSSNGELLTTPGTMPTEEYKARLSSDGAKPSDKKQREEVAFDVVENVTGFIGEEEVTLDEKPESKALSESDLVVRKVREDLQEKGPAKEDDLREGLLCPWAAHLLLGGATAGCSESKENQAHHHGQAEAHLQGWGWRPGERAASATKDTAASELQPSSRPKDEEVEKLRSLPTEPTPRPVSPVSKSGRTEEELPLPRA
ncbi:hypothetical protein HPB49_022719 [Dermacentor silvarum]|uniref:Uncharacterized protein n=1 Tax=Dermacentor silvarum TaxID=543639 RepID=A0ACB8CTH7_DERSI|nr:hypothetical protein HPB49_022719 [Dermacentor silvarum]